MKCMKKSDLKQLNNMFSQDFITFIIVLSLALISIATIALLAILVHDIKNKKVW